MAASRKKKDRKGTAAERWTSSLGTRGHTVRVQETGQPGGIVKLFWYVDGQERKESLGFRMRDERGRVISDRKREALRRAEEKSIEIATADGDSPNGVKPKSAPLTLEAGFDRFFDTTDGYFSVSSRDVLYLRGLGDHIVTTLGGAETWNSTMPTTATRRLGRALAEENMEKKTNRYRTAVRTVDLLFKVGEWLAGDGLINDWRRPNRWKRRFDQEWEEKGLSIPKPKRPRYTTEELSKLVVCFDHPELHPKASLLFNLTWGTRIEQVVCVWRSGIEFSEDGFLTMTIRGSKYKRAGTSKLDDVQVARLEEAQTTGYLSELEAAYQAGRIEDYPLFPQGKLMKGKAPLAAQFKVADRTWIRKHVHRLEDLAGVEHVHGRGWRGVRRRLTDLNPKFAEEARVLNHEGHWTDKSTREDIYQDPLDPELLRAGAHLREKVRASLKGEDSGTGHDLDVAGRVENIRREGSVGPHVTRATLGALDDQDATSAKAP